MILRIAYKLVYSAGNKLFWLHGRSVFVRSFCLLLYILAANPLHAADEVPGSQWCNRQVSHIGFQGNKVTREQVMARELVQQVGQPCSLDDVIDGIQNIMDLGLFKSVRVEIRMPKIGPGRYQAEFSESTSNTDTDISATSDSGATSSAEIARKVVDKSNENGLEHVNVRDKEIRSDPQSEVELVYIVREKIFFLPIPRFSRTSDGELRLGGQLRWDNFLGRLHQLKLTSEKRQEDDGRGRTGYVHKVEYVVPRFFGSRHGMSISAGIERRNAQLARDGVIYGEALRKSRQLEIRLVRWQNHSDGVQGLSYFGGIGIEQRDYEIKSGETGPFSDGLDVTLVAGFDVVRVHQDHYRRRGFQYGTAIRIADKYLDSDFAYIRLDASARWYIPLRRPQTNLNVQARLGLSNLAPFGQRSYEIGGGEMLRGMESGTFTGNILTMLNVEYLSGFFAYPAWRWVAFTDVGNVFKDDKFNVFRQKVRVGGGLRWKLESLTNTDIRLDLAWDPQQARVTPYLSTSLTF